MLEIGCVYLLLAFLSTFGNAERQLRFILTEDQRHTNSSLPAFSDNLIPKLIQCEVNKQCRIVLPIEGKQDQVPVVLDGHRDPGLKVEPIEVWHKLPYRCYINQNTCPYETLVTLSPTEEKSYQHCIQVTQKDIVNVDELCFVVKGIRGNLLNTTQHFNYPPTFPINSTISCPNNLTCHYTVEFKRHGGNCNRPREHLLPDIQINIKETEVKQSACKYDVQITPSATAHGNRVICVSINTATLDVETHCVNVEITSQSRQELAGPCSRTDCKKGSICDAVDGEAECLCQPGFTGTTCEKAMQCYQSFPKSITCSGNNCHLTGIIIGTGQFVSDGNIVYLKQDVNNGNIKIVDILARRDASKICYKVNQTNCFKEECVSVIPNTETTTPTHVPGGLLANNLTFNCNTDKDCYITIGSYPTNNNTCSSVTVHPNTTVKYHRVFPPILTQNCVTTILIKATSKASDKQKLCVNTSIEVLCIPISVKDFEKCNTNPCKNGGLCEASLNGYSCVCFPGWTGSNCTTDIDECRSDPCQYGTCNNGENDYSCTCNAGFTGRQCEIDIDECISDPCLNGVCINGIDSYLCSCKAGYTGRHCETDINECSENPCRYGTCVDEVNNYSCFCNVGYTGRHCQTNINDCKSSPCLNGTCTDGINSYNCTCYAGYTGINCETDIDECSQNPCVNGLCVDGINDYTCNCEVGFSGSDCGTNINECFSNPCINGTCVDGVNSYSCNCNAGFSGHDCDMDIDECASNPCINGTCVDRVNSYTCVCNDGFSGHDCDKDIDECSSNPCIYGTCVDRVNNYICMCNAGVSGHDCDKDIDECASNPCIYGTCVDRVNSYTCDCNDGFSGNNCDKNIDECASNPCKNRAICFDGDNKFFCKCDRGYTGHYCETNIDECSSSPCLNGATCLDLINGFNCSCKEGYTGRFCETNLYHCYSGMNCLNGGTCVQGSCSCHAGFTGDLCETYIDPCLPSPCVHGKCYRHITNFFCDCPAGYTGTTCKTVINNCDTNPCMNGGSCFNSIDSFSCTCPTGFTGTSCQTDIDNCLSNPCMHGGNCIDGQNSFTCQCQYGYAGVTCETVTDFCLLIPCVRGTCFSRATDYHCTCPTGYAGKTCNNTVLAIIGPDRVNMSVPGGSEILLNCSATGVTATYYWTRMNGCGGLNTTTGDFKLQINNTSRADGGIYTCTASNGVDPNVTKTFDVTVNTSLHEKCTFESNDKCSWKQLDNDKFDWTLQKGPTQSSQTGPDTDHTVENGNGAYLYIEASSPRLQGDHASIMSQVLPANHTVCFVFWYYMYGDGIGSLTVSLKDMCTQKETPLFRRAGDLGQKWIKSSITIPSQRVSHDYILVLTGDVGPTFHGDTAIDDLSVTDGTCSD